MIGLMTREGRFLTGLPAGMPITACPFPEGQYSPG